MKNYTINALKYKKKIKTKNRPFLPIFDHNFKCEYCEKEFKRKSHLQRHYKSCKEKKSKEEGKQKYIEDIKDVVNTIILGHKEESKNLKETITTLIEKHEEEKKEIKDELKDQIKELKKDINFHKDLTIKAGKLMDKQLNATVLYLNRNFSDAPPLEAITEADLQERFFEMNKDVIIDVDIIDDKGIAKSIIGEYLVDLYINKKFICGIGDMLIDLYANIDKTRRPAWSTDVNRKSYYIKKQIEKDFSKWISDPKGFEFKRKTIKPLIKFVLHYVKSYMSSLNDKVDEYKKGNKNVDIIAMVDKMCVVSKFILDIEQNDYERDIMNYITPAFHLDK